MVIFKVITSENRLEFYKDEKEIQEILFRLQKLKGENLVKILHVYFLKTGELIIVTRFFKNKNLYQYFHRHNWEIPLEKTLKILADVCKAFYQLEGFEIGKEKTFTMVNRTLKPENLMVNTRGKVYLADFGFWDLLTEKGQSFASQEERFRNRVYMSPEEFYDNNCSPKSNVWSLGLIIYECIFGLITWDKSDCPEKTWKNVIDSLEVLRVANPTLRSLLENMLQKDEQKRLDWKGLVEHKALKDLFSF
jgi:serine/threonine protein kinase